MPYIGKSPGKLGVRQRYYYTATGSETSKSGADDNGLTLKFEDGEYVDVYLNGSLLVAGSDYNTATANTISGLAALAANDVLEVIVYDIYSLAKTNSEAQRTKYYVTATGGETSISGTDDNGATITFTAGAQIDVRLNGVSLKQGDDYNTTVANTVGGLTALTAGQLVEIVVYEKFVLADMVKKSGDTMTGGLSAPSITSSSSVTSNTVKLNPQSSAPSSPTTGEIYYNSGTNEVVHWNGTEWITMSNSFKAEGGTESTYSGYKVHTFTSSGTFTVTGAAGNVDILIVAAGGGTGATQYHNGGAGGGAVLVGTNVNVSPGQYNVVVGAGGAGGTVQGDTTDNGQNGGNSSFDTAVALGGGAGGTYQNTPGNDGGCGGGGAGNGNLASTRNGHTIQGAVTGYTHYGNDGGDGNLTAYNVADWAAGGGGGAGARGQDAQQSNAKGGDGGAGIQNNFRTGSNIYYAGGGGGSSAANVGSGGAGGGGNGATDHTGTNGGVNTGGGGGGLERNGTQTNGTNGGSGIVVVRYAV